MFVQHILAVLPILVSMAILTIKPKLPPMYVGMAIGAFDSDVSES